MLSGHCRVSRDLAHEFRPDGADGALAEAAQPVRHRLISAILGDLMGAPLRDQFALSVDDQARQWLVEHPRALRLFIAYMSSRACCSGARGWDVRVLRDPHAAQPETRG